MKSQHIGIIGLLGFLPRLRFRKPTVALPPFFAQPSKWRLVGCTSTVLVAKTSVPKFRNAQSKAAKIQPEAAGSSSGRPANHPNMLPPPRRGRLTDPPRASTARHRAPECVP